MGTHFGGTLYACEVDYLIKSEWAVEVEDILWRRTKQGLRLSTDQQQELQNYIEKATSLSAVS